MDSSNKPTRFEETAQRSMMGEIGSSQLDRWGMIGDGSEAESFDGSRNLVGLHTRVLFHMRFNFLGLKTPQVLPRVASAHFCDILDAFLAVAIVAAELSSPGTF